MTNVEIINITALIVGPLIGIQVTRYLDDRREIRDRKLSIFKTLMATRAYNLSWDHVEALNRIDLEFDWRKKKEKSVINAWKAYLDLLGDKTMPPDQWSIRRIDLLIDLLHKMANVLDYDFDATTIKNSTYSPVSHGRLEDEQAAIRKGTIEFLEGKRPISIIVPKENNPPPAAQIS
jgi:hypothetical protein